ncbi:MAG TPA: helix-turn-helix transcriptional regulator [Pseudonocardiaceae bacterium]
MVGTTSTAKARALGAELRAAREQAGLSLRALGEKLGKSFTTLSKWENGRLTPRPEEVASYLTALGVRGERLDELVEMARDADAPVWVSWRMPDLQQQVSALLEFERTATRIVDVSPLLIPGLLQTSGYTRAVMTAGGVPRSEIETRVAIRMGRRDVLTRTDDPVSLLALVGETALRTLVGGPRVMLDQLRHLLKMAELPNVDLRVVPAALDWNPVLEGAFHLIEFAEADPIVHLEVRGSALYFHELQDVQGYQEATVSLLELAMSPEESAEFIAQEAKRMEAE